MNSTVGERGESHALRHAEFLKIKEGNYRSLEE